MTIRIIRRRENHDKTYCRYLRDMKKQIYSETNQAFVEWLKSERERKGLSLREVGKLVGRHHSIIGNVETQVRRMDVAEFVEYCELLGLTPQDCFDYIKRKKELSRLASNQKLS